MLTFYLRVGLLGPYAPGYRIDPKDKWGGVDPEPAATCGLYKNQSCYDVSSDVRKRFVIHEGASKFRDPGIYVYDAIDGVMPWNESVICKLKENGTSCDVDMPPGTLCKIVSGGAGGSGCSGQRDFDFTKVGNQTVVYYAVDRSMNVNKITRTVNINDATPPTLKLYPDLRLGLIPWLTNNNMTDLIKDQIQRPRSPGHIFCRCTPSIKEWVDSRLSSAFRDENPESERLIKGCPAEVNGPALDNFDENIFKQIVFKPDSIGCNKDTRNDFCFEERLRCEQVKTPAGLSYFDAGAMAEDTVKPQTIKFYPPGPREKFEAVTDIPDPKETIRVHNSVNSAPQGPGASVILCHLLCGRWCWKCCQLDAECECGGYRVSCPCSSR